MPGAFPAPVAIRRTKKSSPLLSFISTTPEKRSRAHFASTPTFDDVEMGDSDFVISDDEEGDTFFDDMDLLTPVDGEPFPTPRAGSSSSFTSSGGNAGPSVPRTPGPSSRSSGLGKEDIFFGAGRPSTPSPRTPERMMEGRSDKTSRLVRELRQQGVREGWMPSDWESRLSDYGYAS